MLECVRYQHDECAVNRSKNISMSVKSHQLFRISSSQTVYTAGGDVDPLRFQSDVNYLNHFAAKFAQCLGAKTIKHALIEDATTQTAFSYHASPDGIGTVINGIFTRQPEPPEALLNNFNDD
jgi:cAMP phosphodiesterase